MRTKPKTLWEVRAEELKKSQDVMGQMRLQELEIAASAAIEKEKMMRAHRAARSDKQEAADRIYKKIATDAEAQRTAYAQFLLNLAYAFSEDAWLAQNVEGIQAAASAERRRVEIAVEPVV